MLRARRKLRHVGSGGREPHCQNRPGSTIRSINAKFRRNYNKCEHVSFHVFAHASPGHEFTFLKHTLGQVMRTSRKAPPSMVGARSFIATWTTTLGLLSAGKHWGKEIGQAPMNTEYIALRLCTHHTMSALHNKTGYASHRCRTHQFKSLKPALSDMRP